MKIKQIVELCVNEGIKADPRGEKKIRQILEKRKKAYEKMEKEDKEFFDKETLWNPYDDTRILNDSEKEIKTVMIGIDIEEGEILLANELNKKGKKIDAVWSHHPEGRALMGLDEVMHLQTDTFAAAGIPVNQAEAIMGGRIKEVSESLSALNAERTEQMAKLLGIPYLNTHTPSDNHVQEYLTKFIEKKKPETLGDLLKTLKEIPEYKEGMRHKIGPLIFSGSPENACGKIYVDATGGTESSKDAYKKLAENGVGTVVAMHVGKEMREEAEKNNMHVVIAGHIPSDNLGMNLLLDKVEKKVKLNIIECSGFRRVRRK